MINESECDFSLVLTQQGNLPNPVAKLGRQAKVAKLSPIHKKGEVLNPGNYRMIAVSAWGDVSYFRQRAERFGD